MAAIEKIEITDKTKISDLTVDEFKTLMTGLLQEFAWQIEDMLPDPDEGKELKPEIIESLERFDKEKSKGRPAKEVWKELRLDE